MANVLIADSDAVSRRHYQRMFQYENLVEATSVSQAIICLRNGGFDLVVTEWDFPDGTAQPILEYLDRGERTPVVLVSQSRAWIPQLPDIVKRRVWKEPR